jgi:hypothetical protein
MILKTNYRIFHTKDTEYTFFLAAHGTFSKTDHILGHIPTLDKFKKIEITFSFLSNHNGNKLERKK